MREHEARFKQDSTGGIEPTFQPRPNDWQMDYSECKNVTTIDGVHHSRLETDKRNLADKWQSFRNQFLNQPERPLTGSNSYNPNLEQIDFNNVENNSI